MTVRTAYYSLLLTLLLLSTDSTSQNPNETVPGTAGIHMGEPETNVLYTNFGSALIVTVFKGDKSQLDRQAVVSVKRPGDARGYWQATNSQSQVIFVNLIPGTYSIEIAAVGYLPEHRDYVVNSEVNSYRLEITLRPDPMSVDLSAPLGSRMSPKARKATERGLRALKSGHYKKAQEELERAYKLEPSSSDVNGLLGYLYMQQSDRARALPYLDAAVASDAHNVKALTLLGGLRLEQNDYARATPVLEQAVASDGEYWLAHHLLSDAYLQQRDFKKAEQQAQLALVTGKGASKFPLLVLGQALVGLGRDLEAIQALKDYLQDAPKDASRERVEALVGELERRIPNRGSGGSATHLAVLERPPSSLESDELRLSVKSWQPPGVDERKAEVAAGVTCPSEEVLEKTGGRVIQLVESVSRIAAIETLRHESVDELGHPLTRETRQYNYLAEISEPTPGLFSISEFRMIESQFNDFPDQIATKGLAAMALILHPTVRDTFHFVCEGLGQWRGQAAWLFHFRQREDKPNRIHAYRIGGNVYSVDLKGRAWISADTFQIIRVETELVKPRPDIRLLSEHQTVEYGPVAFADKKTELWLPKNVELYADFRNRRLVRRHSYDHFMLFSVDAIEKPREPQIAPSAPDRTPSS